jgi:hypothetical protein
MISIDQRHDIRGHRAIAIAAKESQWTAGF